MRQGRLWLVLLYASASLLVQGAHDHGPGSHAPPTVANIACDDVAVHVEAHPPQGGGHHFDPCLACQFRALNLSWFACETADEPVAVEPAPEFPRITIHAQSTLRPTGRAPPTA